ncbi:VOC family protein [Arthrobacter sp. TMN-37]
MARDHSYDPADGFPRIMPSLRYDDVGGALVWLRDVFGLREHLRWSSDDGVVQHAQMRIDSGFVELARATTDQPSPRTLGRTSSALVVLVDDVDRHHQRARAAGADIVAPLADKAWGLRQYTVEDLEGHRWEFSQQTRRVPPQEWGARLAT